MTDAGTELFLRLREAAVAHDARLRAGLSEDEVAQLAAPPRPPRHQRRRLTLRQLARRGPRPADACVAGPADPRAGRGAGPALGWRGWICAASAGGGRSGRMPAPDGAVTVLPRAAGGAKAGVVGFTAHNVVAADVDPDWVRSVLPPGSLSAPMSARFLAALADRVGAEPGAYDAVAGRPVPGGAAARPRPGRARPTRPGCAGPSATGSTCGPGRSSRRDPHRRPRPGRPLGGLARGRPAVPGPRDRPAPSSPPRPAWSRPAQPLWAQVSPANVASLRMFLAAGYRPVAAEVLFA